MGIWLRRITSLTLIALGIALLFLPFNSTRSGSIDKEIIVLQEEKLLNPDAIRAQFPGQMITDITGPEFNPDDYQDLWRAMINLGDKWLNESGDLEEWHRLQNTILGGVTPVQLVVFREALIVCTIGKDQETGADIALFNYLGRYNLDIQELSEKNLSRYPSIIQAIKTLEAGGTVNFDTHTIPGHEWHKMVDKYLEPLVDSQTFTFDGTFYGPEFEMEYTPIEGTISYLGTLMQVFGALSLLGGFYLIRRLYIRKKGIMVNPQGIALLNDGITLLFAIPSVYMVVTVSLTKTLDIAPLINDDFPIFMGVFFFLVGIPALTLYTSRFTAQSVEIDSEGISVDSLMGKDFIAWQSIESLDFSDEYIVVGRSGMLMPRQLQKCLELKGAEEDQRLTINEPQLKSVKRQIVSRFEQHAPDHLRDTLKNTLDEW